MVRFRLLGSKREGLANSRDAEGKTFAFMEWVWKNRATPSSRRPQFVMKVRQTCERARWERLELTRVLAGRRRHLPGAPQRHSCTQSA